ncbi:hypothetical protein B0H14DRAFT_2577418 [Mycena olivaceomarginata]|nr:hypothetical protein B0H14DRAFT_2577418 [Mycena olivaceomarginata]
MSSCSNSWTDFSCRRRIPRERTSRAEAGTFQNGANSMHTLDFMPRILAHFPIGDFAPLAAYMANKQHINAMDFALVRLLNPECEHILIGSHDGKSYITTWPVSNIQVPLLEAAPDTSYSERRTIDQLKKLRARLTRIVCAHLQGNSGHGKAQFRETDVGNGGRNDVTCGEGDRFADPNTALAKLKDGDQGHRPREEEAQRLWPRELSGRAGPRRTRAELVFEGGYGTPESVTRPGANLDKWRYRPRRRKSRKRRREVPGRSERRQSRGKSRGSFVMRPGTPKACPW